MRPQISNQNLERLEEASGMKISKNCDQAVSEVLDELDELKAEKEENDSFDMTVCDETKKEMKQVA